MTTSDTPTPTPAPSGLVSYTGGQPEVDLQSLLAQASASQQDINQLLQGADFVIGRALVDKDTLLGVPHIITSATFRKGNKDASGAQHDYVSCEFTTLPTAGHAQVDGVYNDGSTGIRRQVVQYLAHKTDLPASYVEAPDALVWSVAMESQVESGEPTDPVYPIKLIAPRGLRKSEYSNDFSDEAVTYYLA